MKKTHTQPELGVYMGHQHPQPNSTFVLVSSAQSYIGRVWTLLLLSNFNVFITILFSFVNI